MKNPNPLMLVRIAQGDAYGMCCEYIKLPRDQELHDKALKFEKYEKHPTHFIEPGKYTDDTQMSIAVAEVLVNQQVGPLHSQELVRKWFSESFYDCFQRDKRHGYSRGFQEILERSKSAEHMLTLLKPTSDKNGAAMRSVPLGVLANVNHVKYVANIQAKITHDTLGGTSSSLIVALMSHYALHTDLPLQDMQGWLRKNLPAMPEHFLAPWPGGPVEGPEVGVVTARAVMTALMQEQSLLDVARRVITWGGDTDSVLAIAWGIASTRMKEELPPFFATHLEGGRYGHRFLAELGEKLMAKYA